jgi:hypothetical protein
MIQVRSLIDDAIGSVVIAMLNQLSQIYVHGDWTEGDKIGTDKVEGDKTEL